MDKETLRMQMLSGVITESEYKQKLEEKSPFSGEKMDLSLIKNIEWPDFVLQELEQDFPQIDFKTLVIGNLFPEEGPNDGAREAEVVSAKDLKGNDVDEKTLKKLNSRNRYEIIDIVLNNWDPYWKSQKKKKSLKESMIGGIVGIGAINQIPSRAKADYEDAFEHFLGQKYGINEEMDEVEEGKEVEEPSLYEGEDDLFTAKRFYKRTDNPRINILANLRAIDDIVMDMLETDLVKGYGPDERDDIYREYMKFVNAIQNLVK